MTDLAKVSLLVGAIVGGLHLPLLLAPAFAKRFLAGFPRNRLFAWILTGVDLIWAAWLLAEVPLGRFDVIKNYLPVLTPIAFFVVAFFMEELLAARSLGGLLVLVPALLLNVARSHESQMRLVVVVFAYILVVEGIVLLLSPYWFRKTVQVVAADDKACRIIGAGGVCLGLLLIVLGFTVY